MAISDAVLNYLRVQGLHFPSEEVWTTGYTGRRWLGEPLASILIAPSTNPEADNSITQNSPEVRLIVGMSGAPRTCSVVALSDPLGLIEDTLKTGPNGPSDNLNESNGRSSRRLGDQILWLMTDLHSSQRDETIFAMKTRMTSEQGHLFMEQMRK